MFALSFGFCLWLWCSIGGPILLRLWKTRDTSDTSLARSWHAQRPTLIVLHITPNTGFGITAFMQNFIRCCFVDLTLLHSDVVVLIQALRVIKEESPVLHHDELFIIRWTTSKRNHNESMWIADLVHNVSLGILCCNVDQPNLSTSCEFKLKHSYIGHMLFNLSISKFTSFPNALPVKAPLRSLASTCFLGVSPRMSWQQVNSIQLEMSHGTIFNRSSHHFASAAFFDNPWTWKVVMKV